MERKSVRLCIKLISLALLLGLCTASGQDFYVSSGAAARSQVNPNFLSYTASADFLFINRLKESAGWGNVSPANVDANGYPLIGGLTSYVFTPTQLERPGNKVVSWIGSGNVQLGETALGGTLAACTGTGGRWNCNNSGCASFTGSISNTTLAALTSSLPSGNCALHVGQPIYDAAATIFSDPHGVPTIITTAGTSGGSCPATFTCFTVNFSQTVASETIESGGRLEITPVIGGEGPSIPAWALEIVTTTAGNEVRGIGIYNKNDEPTYWTGEQFSSLFKQRIAQGNFATLRDLNLAQTNSALCTTWATRTPQGYYSYGAAHLWNAASGPGQYVDAAGDGASGGTISYNSGTDTYSVTLGSGNWTDKQTISVLWPATGTVNSQISINGNTPVPVFGYSGNALSSGQVPTSGQINLLVYDAEINSLGAGGNYGAVLQLAGGTLPNGEGLNCGVPPEVFVQLNAETHTNPWITADYLAIDPMTDYYPQYLTYIKTNYPNMVPELETPDELWNGAVNPGCYASAKSRVYIVEDPTHWNVNLYYCGPGGTIPEWEGKVASTLGQAIYNVYGNTSKYVMIEGYKTNDGVNGGAHNQSALLSGAYVSQTIPVQSGYTQTAAYNWINGGAVNNYWNTDIGGTQAEVADAYNYFNGSTSQQATIMANYMAGAYGTNSNFTIAKQKTYYAAFQNWLFTCDGQSSTPGTPGCQGAHLYGYEGTYTDSTLSVDQTVAVTSVTNGNPCVINTSGGNGAVAGMTIGLKSIANGSGGTWGAAQTYPANSYTVQASGLSGTAIPINLDCTSLGPMTATLDYVGSANYISYLREMSYLSPQLYSYTLDLYSSFAGFGGQNPSLFTLSGGLSSSYPWTAWSSDIYGYFQLASCTGCTLSGTTLTLGGTVTGIFAPGQTLAGKFVSNVSTGAPANTTIVGSCTTSGPGPCGSNSGDTFVVSNAPTQVISVGESMIGSVTPQENYSGTGTTSPITQWGAICHWNGNTNACNGGFLLKRDLDPASNDNSAMWVNEAA